MRFKLVLLKLISRAVQNIQKYFLTHLGTSYFVPWLMYDLIQIMQFQLSSITINVYQDKFQRVQRCQLSLANSFLSLRIDLVELLYDTYSFFSLFLSFLTRLIFFKFNFSFILIKVAIHEINYHPLIVIKGTRQLFFTAEKKKLF